MLHVVLLVYSETLYSWTPQTFISGHIIVKLQLCATLMNAIMFNSSNPIICNSQNS